MRPVGYLLEPASAVPPDDSWLAPAERGTLAGLHVAKRRADWRLGRWALKRAVARAMHRAESPADLGGIEIRTAPSGAPTVWVDGRPAPCAVSLSHSAGVAFCVVAPVDIAIGCDLEQIEARDDAFVDTFFAEAEQQAVVKVRAELRDRLITLCWSAKESATKAMGEGLRLDVRDLVVDCDLETLERRDPRLWAPVTVTRAEERLQGWWRLDPAGMQVVVGSSQIPPPTPLTPSWPTVAALS